MNIQYASDLHLEFYKNLFYVKKNINQIFPGGDTLILAGDTLPLSEESINNSEIKEVFDYLSDHYKHILCCYGNHDFYSGLDIVKAKNKIQPLNYKNISYLYNDVDVSYTERGDKVYIIVSPLWSCPNIENIDKVLSDFTLCHYKNKIISLEDYQNLYKECLDYIFSTVKDIENIKHPNDKIIVVTHFSPSFFATNINYPINPLTYYFCNNLDNEIKDSEIDYWIYGHTHGNTDVKIGKTKIITNQLGYINSEDTWLSFINKQINI